MNTQTTIARAEYRQAVRGRAVRLARMHHRDGRQAIADGLAEYRGR